MHRFVPRAFMGVGGLIIFCAQVYYFFWHPEWTAPQAFKELWAVYFLALTLIAAGIRMETPSAQGK